MIERDKPIIIAGPCAAESRDQIIGMAVALKEMGITNMRASLWKPRTRPGFDGVGETGLPWMAEASRLGITVGTEVMLPQHAEKVIDNLVGANSATQVLLWIGSRNQNHLIQRDIGLAAKGAPVKIMIKNQPWVDEAHWLGIVDHVVDSGFPAQDIILCHRGFAPNGHNPNGLRNIPDWEMATRVQEITRLPMIIDPSHIGGSVDNVFDITRQALLKGFDSFIVEVHPHPAAAQTDSKQQLSLQEFSALNHIMRRHLPGDHILTPGK